MRTPRDMRGWNGVLNTSMTIVTCLYIAVGFFGYLKYGEDVQGSITLNLPVDQWYVFEIIRHTVMNRHEIKLHKIKKNH